MSAQVQVQGPWAKWHEVAQCGAHSSSWAARSHSKAKPLTEEWWHVPARASPLGGAGLGGGPRPDDHRLIGLEHKRGHAFLNLKRHRRADRVPGTSLHSPAGSYAGPLLCPHSASPWAQAALRGRHLRWPGEVHLASSSPSMAHASGLV